MHKNLKLTLDILQGALALCICYMLIFQDERTKLFWGVLGLFFASLAIRSAYKRRLTGKS